MQVEYSINNIEDKEIDIKNSIDIVATYPVSSIMGTIHSIKHIRKILHDKMPVGCYVDYPLASSAFARRTDLVKDAIDHGANIIAITIPFYYMINRKYDKLREDIAKNFLECAKYNIELRYILEYRRFEHSLLAKICDILVENSITTIYPSTGFFIDNMDDNIIACAYLTEKSKIKTIVNGNLWQTKQADSIIKMNPPHVSINNLNGLDIFFSRLNENK